MKPKICIIGGPTAAGKTDLAVRMAKALQGEVISADSAQVYRYMDIGTAKATPEEMDGVPHHMIDIVDPDEPFSVAEFQRLAEAHILELTERGKLPILCGGTGLYINALLNNLDFTRAVGNPEYRRRLETLAEERGREYVHGLLREVDEASYHRLFPNDLKRVIRALEVYQETGKTITYFQEESKKLPPRYEFSYVSVGMDRSRLYDRIDLRVELMLEKGLVEEVRGLLNRGYTTELVSMQALGYKEIAWYLNEAMDLDEAVRILKRDSRHFAKRQFTWFKNDPRVCWFNTDTYANPAALCADTVAYTKERLGLR